MALAVLLFDMHEPDDLIDYRQCVSANDMAVALWTYRETLRRKMKHNEGDTLAGLEVAFADLIDELEAHGIDLEALCP